MVGIIIIGTSTFGTRVQWKKTQTKSIYISRFGNNFRLGRIKSLMFNTNNTIYHFLADDLFNFGGVSLHWNLVVGSYRVPLKGWDLHIPYTEIRRFKPRYLYPKQSRFSRYETSNFQIGIIFDEIPHNICTKKYLCHYWIIFSYICDLLNYTLNAIFCIYRIETTLPVSTSHIYLDLVIVLATSQERNFVLQGRRFERWLQNEEVLQHQIL